MYLTHHYFIHVVGGSCLAIAFFYLFLTDDLEGPFVTASPTSALADGGALGMITKLISLAPPSSLDTDVAKTIIGHLKEVVPRSSIHLEMTIMIWMLSLPFLLEKLV